MQTVQVTERADDDGTVHVSVPRLTPGSEYEVLVVVHPKAVKVAAATPEGLGWPTGYFEKTFGSIDDDTFVRPPQGEMPKPVEFD
jgi:hypothetical protein